VLEVPKAHSRGATLALTAFKEHVVLAQNITRDLRG
jgi:hypothetical protein